MKNKLNGHNKPMKEYQRITVETADDRHTILAEIVDGNFELADGIRIRITPVYGDKKAKRS